MNRRRSPGTWRLLNYESLSFVSWTRDRRFSRIFPGEEGGVVEGRVALELNSPSFFYFIFF